MKDYMSEIQYNGKTYLLVFNLNVIEAIQAEYGTVEKWGALTDGDSDEPDAKAVIFGFREMLNEGIDISNEEHGEHEEFLSHRKVGRIISDLGFDNANAKLNETVIEATKSDEKNELSQTS